MSVLHAIILGIVQGLTEFLPISSSGHLTVIPQLFGWTELTSNPSLNKTFDVALHLGTLIAVVVYFGKDLARYAVQGVRALWSPEARRGDGRIGWLLLVSAVPAAIVGAVLEKTIEEHLGKPLLIGIVSIVFGLILWGADRLHGTRTFASFNLRDAILIGSAQILALQPGVSRSGITITGGRTARYSREAATRISFLMLFPITAGAVLFKGVKLFSNGGIPAGFQGAFLWGTVAAAISGLLVIWGLLRFVRTHSYLPFVIYRVVVGGLVIALVLGGWL
ncbi:MAG: undecaprenyl-diphosphate phosphatase [Acidimicrobiia bacterium]